MSFFTCKDYMVQVADNDFSDINAIRLLAGKILLDEQKKLEESDDFYALRINIDFDNKLITILRDSEEEKYIIDLLEFPWAEVFKLSDDKIRVEL